MTSPDKPPTTFARTARWMAAARAQESLRADRLFTDPFAELFAGSEGQAMLARSQEASGGSANPYLPVRTRYFDDFLLNAAQQHTQVVLLGAGFDTRAFRLPLSPHVQLFELDSAELLAEKNKLLSMRSARPQCQRSTVAANLSREDWAYTLIDAGFDTARSTLWLAEGLLYYLGARPVVSLLRQTRALSASGSQLLADVFGAKLLAMPSMQPYLRWLEHNELPAPFCTDDPVGLFTPCGWAQAQSVLPGSRDANYGRLTRVPPSGAASAGPQRAYFVNAMAQAEGW